MELVIFECANATDMLSDMMIIVYEITAGNTIKPKKKKRDGYHQTIMKLPGRNQNSKKEKNTVD